MFIKIFIAFIFLINFFTGAHANEKQSILNQILQINNFTFDFEQITNNKIETGYCILVFDNKLKCNYDDNLQKQIIVNNRTLVVFQKRYNKIYFYPMSKSPFINILSKDKLITLIKKSDLKLNDNIELIYLDEDNKKITVFFKKKSYELIGWLITDELQNEIFFSLKIKKINIEIDQNIFKIPATD